MKEFLILLGIFALWFSLQRWVLPACGVKGCSYRELPAKPTVNQPVPGNAKGESRDEGKAAAK